MNKPESLLDVLKTLVKWKKPILKTTGVVVIGTILISLLMSDYYRSTTIFYPSNPQIASRGALFGNSDEALDPYGESEEMNRLILVAESTELMDYIINKFFLYKHYEIDSTHVRAKEKARKAFRNLFEVKKNDNDAIELSIEDVEPERTADMLWAIIGKIDEISHRLTLANQEKIISSYKKSIDVKEAAFVATSDSLNLLRQKYGIVDLESQGEYLSQSVSMTESKLVGNRARLDMMKKTSNLNRDTLAKVTAMVAYLEKQHQALTSPDSRISLSRFNEGRGRIGMLEIRMEEMAEELQFLKNRYFEFQSVYSTYISSIYVVEAPSIPIVKSRPRRSIIVISMFLFSLILCSLGALLFETYKDIDWKEILNA